MFGVDLGLGLRLRVLQSLLLVFLLLLELLLGQLSDIGRFEGTGVRDDVFFALASHGDGPEEFVLLVDLFHLLFGLLYFFSQLHFLVRGQPLVGFPVH